jgi:Copper binding proteins, plastocyanin/azurin family
MWRTGIAIVAAASALLPGSAIADDPPTLTAIVGIDDGFNITLNDASGETVTRLLPGTYAVVVDDRSTIHNFHLASNVDTTVDFRTDLEFVGKQSFTVTFQNHTVYAYACEPHWQTMNGSFLVTDTPVAPPPPPPPPPPRVKILKASVSASGTVRLSSSSVRSGRYRILVSDRSRLGNFHLAGKGVNKHTGMRFRGSATWRVRLARGSYRYGSDRQGLRKRLSVR